MHRAVALALSLVLLTACAPRHATSGTATPTPTAVDPVTALLAASLKVGQSTMHIQYQLNSGGDAERVDADYDAATHAIRLHTSWVIPELQVFLTGSDVYVKWPGLSTRPWVHAELATLSPHGRIRILLSIFLAVRPLAGVASATEVKPHEYEGELTFDEAVAAATDPVEREAVNGLAGLAGAHANEVPFTASLDAQGRLSEFHYLLGDRNSSGMYVEVSLFNYDVPFTIEVPPAASLAEAKPSDYAKL